MSNDIIFADGMKVFAAKGPEFIWCNVVINTEEFAAWMYNNVDENGQVKLNICESKRTGNLYAKLDTWKPNGGGPTRGRPGSQQPQRQYQQQQRQQQAPPMPAQHQSPAPDPYRDSPTEPDYQPAQDDSVDDIPF